MSTPIRVLFVIGTMSTGGSERQLLGILRRLDRKQFAPRLYVVYRDGELLAEVPDDVPVHSYWDRHSFPRFNYPGRILARQSRDLEQVIREHDIQVVYDRTYFMTLLAAPATQRCRVPRVSVVANDPANYLRETAGGWLPIKRWFLKRSYRSAFRVGTVSSGVRDSVIKYYGLPPDQVVTLHNAIDFERFDQLAARPGPDWARDRFHLVAAGRLHSQKGYPFLLEAVEQLVQRRQRTDIQLHIMGRGPDDSRLRSWVAEHGLDDHVDFMGFVENPYPAMRQADLFCLPSIYEGNPNALVEAIACRTPLLATDCPSGPREILDGGKYGCLVPVGDSGSLADGIESAVDETEAWQARVEPARRHVEQLFSPAAAIARLQEVLVQAVTEREG